MSSDKKQIFILSGQSNMAGRGGVRKDATGAGEWDGVVPEQCGPHPSILRFSSTSQWVPAQEPLHADIDASKICGVGPGMAFANAVLRSATAGGGGVTIGLVPCAVGGTAIREWEKGAKLYGDMMRRAREAVEDGGGDIKAVVWYQGESDASSEELVEAYKGNLERFIGDVRSDLGLPSLPFVQVAIASGDERFMDRIREIQLGINLPKVVCVDAKGLPLKEDHLHLPTQSQVVLGNKLAEAYLKNFAC